jgi:hypothetical protein
MVRRRLDRAERLAAEPNDEAAHAAVADDEVGADADRRDRDRRRQALQQVGEIVLVGRRDERLGRAADPEPGEGRKRDLRGEPAAQFRRESPDSVQRGPGS